MLSIHYRLQESGKGELIVIEPTGIHYLLSHISEYGNVTIHSVRRNSVNTITMYYEWDGAHSLKLPFYTSPIRYDQLPRNDALGITIPPSVMKMENSNRSLYSNRTSLSCVLTSRSSGIHYCSRFYNAL